jgi:hypothetical protein
MTTTFLDDIQIDEFDCIIPKEDMFDLFDDNWESVTETDVQDWMMIEK